MKRFLIALAPLLLSVAASAQINPVNTPFTGTQSEGFEAMPFGMFVNCLSPRPFNNTADLCTPGQSGAHVTSGWGFMCTIFAHSGNKFYGSAGGITEITFDNPVQKFGGYFGTNNGTPDGVINFFDSSNNQIGSANANVPADCNWYWNGWETASGNSDIKRIQLISNAFGGAFLDMDDLVYESGCTGNRMVYCTSKVNSAGCTPSIGSTGIPSATAGSGFVISTVNELDNRNGLYFYSKTGSNNSPFQGGFLCALAPLIRTPVQNSGGTPPCGGMYSIDFNAYIASGVDPALVSGQQVWMQTWSRDPASPSTTNLSDALTFVICP
jgi:hypothetical protein